MISSGLLPLCLLGCLSKTPVPKTIETIVPEDIAQYIPSFKKYDHRPYELIWSNRHEEEEPLVDFENLVGWQVEAFHGATGSFARSNDLQLWGEYVGKLTFSSSSTTGQIWIRPPKPIAISDQFDAIDLWLFGPKYQNESNHKLPLLEVILHIENASNEQLAISMGSVDWEGWQLIHHKFVSLSRKNIAPPYWLTGIEFRHCSNKESAEIYMDSLSVYTERLPPLNLNERPSRSFELVPGQSEGLHVKKEQLSFPLTEQTMLPVISTERFQNETILHEDGSYYFVYNDVDEKIRYRFLPHQGLSGIELYINNEPICRMLEGASLHGISKPADIVVLREEGPVVRVEYSNGESYALWIHQKTLLIDVVCRGGTAEGLSLGYLEGSNPSAILIPTLTYGLGDSPRIAMLESKNDDVIQTYFASIWIDWYRSNATSLYTAYEHDEEYVVINGGVRYLPKTDGRRNDIFERIVLSISSRIEEVLPSIPHPKSSHTSKLVEHIWMDSPTPLIYEEEIAKCKTYLHYGLEHVVHGDGPEIWRDEFESPSFRTKAAPYKGGDHGLNHYYEQLKSFGWDVATYLNYSELSPLNADWSSDHVQRNPQGGWHRTSDGLFAIKPTKALSWQDTLSSQIALKFSPSATVVDGRFASVPWMMTDFDARVPGAGSYAHSYYCYGELLSRNLQYINGPTVLSGAVEWLYAGLVDAHLAYDSDPALTLNNPYLPIFYLTKIHPLSSGIGVGSFASFFKNSTDKRTSPSTRIDQYLAAQIAYGRLGRLANASFDKSLICRSYYMMQQLQVRYAKKLPLRIAYWNGDQFLTTSEALASQTYLRSQLYFNYPGDLELWVNGSNNEDWKVRLGRSTWSLPPYGWLASADDFIEISAKVDGRRLDYVKTKEYIYYDGRGRTELFNGIACRSSIVFRFIQREDSLELRVIDIDQTGHFSFTFPRLKTWTLISSEGYSGDNNTKGDIQIIRDNELFEVGDSKNVLRYVFTFKETQQ